MCGLVALIGLRNNCPDNAMLIRLANTQEHRGPDNVGTYRFNNVGFGFRRLSILDLSSAGNQPMESACGRYVVVFNGQIYNYLELRGQLTALGFTFRSNSDTEVLLAAYKQWGRQCVNRLNGMWAFLIHDKLSGEMFGSRDRFGEKPLFVFRNSHWLLFTSEIKAIRDSGIAQLHVNWSIVSDWLSEQLLDHTSETFYKEVLRVPAGTCFQVDAHGETKFYKYWTLDNNIAVPSANPAEEFAALFEDAVAIRTRSDVPVGVMLSGGLDSVSIACALRRHLQKFGAASETATKAFSYHDEQFDESEFVSAAIKYSQMSYHPLQACAKQLWQTLPSQLQIQDEPVHSATPLIGALLMKMAREHGTVVVLGGQGADEVLGGYYDFYRQYWLSLIGRGKLWTATKSISTFNHFHRSNLDVLLLGLAKSIAARNALRFTAYRERAALRRVKNNSSSSWFKGQAIGSGGYAIVPQSGFGLKDNLRGSIEFDALPLFLRIEDRNSMAASVETRLPFLDYRLVSFADKLADSWKLSAPWNKFILRESMKNRIPEIVRQRLGKFGFPTPVDRWFKNEWNAPMRELMSEREASLMEFVNVRHVRSALDDQESGKISEGAKLFNVAQLALWLKQCTDAGVSL